MKSYDAIVVLGHSFTKKWRFPSRVYRRLRLAARLYKRNKAPKIILLGKWSRFWDKNSIKPPYTEAEKMVSYLRRLKVPNDDLVKEERSVDTIENAFYFKKLIAKPNNYKRFLVICDDYHLERAKYVFSKFFKNGFSMDFLPHKTNLNDVKKFILKESSIFKVQKEFLEK